MAISAAGTCTSWRYDESIETEPRRSITRRPGGPQVRIGGRSVRTAAGASNCAMACVARVLKNAIAERSQPLLIFFDILGLFYFRKYLRAHVSVWYKGSGNGQRVPNIEARVARSRTRPCADTLAPARHCTALTPGRRRTRPAGCATLHCVHG